MSNFGAPTFHPETGVIKYETGTLVWVGCHRVEQNPSPEGSTASFLLLNLKKGDKMYLQQLDHNGNADVTVGELCK